MSIALLNVYLTQQSLSLFQLLFILDTRYFQLEINVVMFYRSMNGEHTFVVDVESYFYRGSFWSVLGDVQL